MNALSPTSMKSYKNRLQDRVDCAILNAYKTKESISFFLWVKFTRKQFRLSKTPILSLRNRRTH